MTPTVQQLDHAIANLEKLVEAKTLEIGSYATLRDCAQAVLADLLPLYSSDPPEYHGRTRLALTHFFSAKHTLATIELEELQMMLAGRRQQRSGVVGANMVIPPFNSKRN